MTQQKRGSINVSERTSYRGGRKAGQCHIMASKKGDCFNSKGAFKCGWLMGESNKWGVEEVTSFQTWP